MQYLCLFLLVNVVLYDFVSLLYRVKHVYALYFCLLYIMILLMYVLSFLINMCSVFFVIELLVLWFVKGAPAIRCDVSSKMTTHKMSNNNRYGIYHSFGQ